MSRTSPTRIGFRRERREALDRAVARLAERGAGWLNVEPDPDDVDPRGAVKPSVFSGRGRAVPLGTFVAGGSGTEHQLGLEHGAGRHAAKQLQEAGVAFPDGARLVQDHPRRGLIIAVPHGTAAAAVSTLLLQMAAELTMVPLGDRWIADVYDG